MGFEQSQQQEYEQDQILNKQKAKFKVSKRIKKLRIPPDIDNPPYYLPLKPLSERYHLISTLGNGSFGSVTLAKSLFSLHDASNFLIFNGTLIERGSNYGNENASNKKSRLVAIKSINEKLATLNDYTRVKEVRFILSIPYHVNLVQVYEMFIDNGDYRLHIVMECMDLNLHQLIKVRKHNHFSLPTLRSILAQVLNGIRHIHRSNYFHRDIKPENILISPTNTYYDPSYLCTQSKTPDNFVVKIADYGLARHVDNRRPYTSYISTRWYRAPEILLRKEWYSRPVDIWAFGSVAAEVATFRPLFPGSDELEQTCKVLEVLGTPISNNDFEMGYTPSYGYWDEAVFLSSKLGLRFPMNRCIDIGQIIPGPELAPLCDVIRACLLWNPNERSDAERIARMPYFKGTCIDDYDRYPLQSTSQGLALSPSFKENFNTKTGSLEKSSKFAGIPARKPSQNSTQNQTQQDNISLFKPGSEDPKFSSTYDSEIDLVKVQEPNTSTLLNEYLEESDDSMGNERQLKLEGKIQSSTYFKTRQNEFTNDLDKLPLLTRDDTNDENRSSLAPVRTHKHSTADSGNAREHLKQLPATNLQPIHSYDQASIQHENYGASNSYAHNMEIFNTRALSKYTGFHSYDESNVRNTERLDNASLKFPHNSGSLTTKQVSDINEAEFYDQRLGFQGDLTRDSLKALYERDYTFESVSAERGDTPGFNTAKNREPRFTDELYSKFNLHRLDTDHADRAFMEGSFFDNNNSITSGTANSFEVYP